MEALRQRIQASRQSSQNRAVSKDRFERLMSFDLDQQFSQLTKMIEKRHNPTASHEAGRLTTARKVRFLEDDETPDHGKRIHSIGPNS
jgi:hypothetical protein